MEKPRWWSFAWIARVVMRVHLVIVWIGSEVYQLLLSWGGSS